jgi:abortive infection bacteriophage resistance protein
MLKEPTAYRQQIEKLREHGCIISDETFCEKVLSQISYYRLSAYFLPFKTANGKYKSGTDFLKVYRIYEFDRRLRNLLFSTIEEIEVFLRARLSYYHSHIYGADGYMCAVYYNDRHNHEQFLKRTCDMISNNSRAPFVKHHITMYDCRFPIWVLMELFTFGMLSRFYADLKLNDQKQIARDMYGTVPKSLKSWLRCCTDLRNFCAHYGRLYYRVFTAIPANIPQLTDTSERRLFGAVMVLRELYPDDKKWNEEILTTINALIKEYIGVIILQHIGFPANWEEIMRK